MCDLRRYPRDGVFGVGLEVDSAEPDNFVEALPYLLYMAAGRAPMIPLDTEYARENEVGIAVAE